MNLEPSEIFKVLSVDTRIRIIEILKSKDSVGVKKIAEMLNITDAAVSQHLKILRQAGLVRKERKGYWIPYSIDEKSLENCRCIINEVCTCGCGIKKQDINTLSLSSLMKYEKELKKELKNVQESISEIRKQKK